VFTAS